jgi:hypothetical protein
MHLYLLDYGAGNVQSLANSLKKLGHNFQWISSPDDFDTADVSRKLSYHLLPTNPHQLLLTFRSWFSPVLVPSRPQLITLHPVVSLNRSVNISNRVNHTLGFASECKFSSNHPQSLLLPLVSE